MCAAEASRAISAFTCADQVGLWGREVQTDIDWKDGFAAQQGKEAGLQQRRFAQAGKTEQNAQPFAHHQAEQILGLGFATLKIALIGFAKGQQSRPRIVGVDGWQAGWSSAGPPLRRASGPRSGFQVLSIELLHAADEIRCRLSAGERFPLSGAKPGWNCRVVDFRIIDYDWQQECFVIREGSFLGLFEGEVPFDAEEASLGSQSLLRDDSEGTASIGGCCVAVSLPNRFQAPAAPDRRIHQRRLLPGPALSFSAASASPLA